MPRIGITERGDASVDLSWAGKVKMTDYSVIITKNPTKEIFQKTVLNNKNKVLLHATITGWGATAMEPFVPAPEDTVKAVETLISNGFPKEQVVWRIDPIIPTKEGFEKAQKVFELIKNSSVKRIRVSILDAYPHTKARMEATGYPLDYNTFTAPTARFKAADAIFASWKSFGFTVEACAEPLLTEPIAIGCVNFDDAKIFGLNLAGSGTNPQNRHGCLCCSAKTELLTNRKQCPHKCAYCYWK